MSYGTTLLTNGSAETGDTTGWAVTNVTVVADTVTDEQFAPQLVQSTDIKFGNWMLDDYTPFMVLSGETGEHYFLLGATASMEQVMLASDIGDLPDINFMVTVDYKLTTAQELYDAEVKGWVEIEILYSDETKDLFAIPCTKGLDRDGRNLDNYWLRTEANISFRANSELSITSIGVTAKTVSLTGGLKINQIKLEKNLEVDTDIDGGDEGQVLTTDDEGKPIWKFAPPTFIFTISGALTAEDNPCPALPAPYACTVDKVYAYVKTAPENAGAGGDAIVIDILKNGTTMFPGAYLPEMAKIQHGAQTAESDTPYNITPYSKKLAKNDVMTMNVDQVGDSVAGSDLTVEVRCK